MNREFMNSARDYVQDLWKTSASQVFFHNLKHTEKTVMACEALIEAEDIPGDLAEQLLLASWFRNTAYAFEGDFALDRSCEYLKDFWKQTEQDKKGLEIICEMILATDEGVQPKTPETKIFSDIYWSFLGSKTYSDFLELHRMEYNELGDKELTVSEWRQREIKFLRLYHQFYTDYAQEHWEPVKRKHLKKLLKRKKKGQRLKKKEKLKAQFKSQIPDRGVQTLYRVTLRNHIKLSDIADTKANILLSVNAIIISLALSNLIPKLDNPSNTYLIYPTLIFVIFSIISMALSIAATRPNVTKGTFDKQDVRDRKVNLLFFGNFHQMALKNYEWAISRMLKDQDYIYSNLTKDLYYLGVVLERKYRILRWTYTIFLIGIIVSVLAFGVAFRYLGPDRLNL